MMTDIRAVGFDYGGVIAIHKTVMPQIAQICGLSVDELKAEYFLHNHLANVGDLSYPEVWKLVVSNLGKSDRYNQIVKVLQVYDQPDLDERMIKLIDQLKNNNYKVGLLSNNTKANAHQLRQIGLDKHFDAFMVSAEIGHQKPNREAFMALFEALRVSPEQSIFIDDSSNSLRLASEIGFRPILFKSYEDLLQEFSELNIRVN